jgi:hypothetical protein
MHNPTELISPEQREAAIHSAFPKFVPASEPQPEAEAEVVESPSPLPGVFNRIGRNLPSLTRWFRG